jgi:hypothetical protein
MSNLFLQAAQLKVVTSYTGEGAFGFGECLIDTKDDVALLELCGDHVVIALAGDANVVGGF